MNRPTKIVLVLVAAIAVSAGMSYLVHERVLKPARAREDAFAALREGSLSPDAAGVAVLPQQWAMASADGKVYVTGSRDRTLWALFPAEVAGDGKKFKGWLYCNRGNQAAPKSMVDLESTPLGRPAPVKVFRALSPYAFEASSEK
jgi:hypothetical protein